MQRKQLSNEPKERRENKMAEASFQRLLALLSEVEEIELENFKLEADELTLSLARAMMPAIMPFMPAPELAKPGLPTLPLFREVEFKSPVIEYPGEIVEVQLGATKSEGGTREYVVKLGGQKIMPFYRFLGSTPNPPVVSLDVFDMPLKLAKAVRTNIEDVMEDPAEWAKRCINKFGADMVTIHLISTDPYIKDTPAKEAAKVVEDVLQAVKCPIVIGGSGNKDKDPVVLTKAAEVAEGEQVLINSADLHTYKPVVEAAKKYGHVVLSWTQLDINNQKKLNTLIMDEGFPREKMIIDPTTASLGYGLEYTYSIMERIRLAALKGDEILQMPMSSGTTNAWGAREAFLSNKKCNELGLPWGDVALRGPLWETLSAMSVMLAGADLLMMMHPGAVAGFKALVKAFTDETPRDLPPIGNWVTMK